ncbi:MAG: 16S rRNA (cytosine(1402)-N(4))-methyltransferase RsmH [Burkholderiaceae bacterium]
MTDGAPPPPHQRRARYRGTHPRQFQEKYKELDPAAYAAEVDKVLQRGQTPAGTHRSICVDEILAILDPQPGEHGLDATLGFGGHTQALMPRILPGGQMVGLDVDSIELPRTRERLRALGFMAPALNLYHSNFSELAQFLPERGRRFDFVLADLGVSSMQIDNPTRGFSFKVDGPLDLRLDPLQGQSASELLSAVTRQRLRELLTENADEPYAVPLAAALQGQFVETTSQLAELIRATVALQYKKSMPAGERVVETKKALQRTFQALRIEVNNEFGVLDALLRQLPACLAPGGRVAILSFHSGEDRRVKKAFQTGERDGTYVRVAPDPIRPSFEERRANPRASSAKLRWAVRA